MGWDSFDPSVYFGVAVVCDQDAFLALVRALHAAEPGGPYELVLLETRRFPLTDASWADLLRDETAVGLLRPRGLRCSWEALEALIVARDAMTAWMDKHKALLARFGVTGVPALHAGQDVDPIDAYDTELEDIYDELMDARDRFCAARHEARAAAALAVAPSESAAVGGAAAATGTAADASTGAAPASTTVAEG